MVSLPMTDHAPKTKFEGVDNGPAIYTGTGSIVCRKLSVKGSGGVSATVVVTVRQGRVWMSIQPPFTWEAIMEPGKVDEPIRRLTLAADGAKKMTRAVNPSSPNNVASPLARGLFHGRDHSVRDQGSCGPRPSRRSYQPGVSPLFSSPLSQLHCEPVCRWWV